jgi:transposase
MNKSNRFSPEVRERAVRMVQDHRSEYPSLWAAIESIAPKIGCVPQTLHDWATLRLCRKPAGIARSIPASPASAQRVRAGYKRCDAW